MDERILLLDDEIHLLTAYQRYFRESYEVITSDSPNEGLELIEKEGPFAVIVADYRMPAMDGIEFLSRAYDLAPDSIRIMLTGYADLKCAMDAVNEGNVFRFLTKPCSPSELKKIIDEGIREYRLITIRREFSDFGGEVLYRELLDGEWSSLHLQILGLLKRKNADYANPVISDDMGKELNITPSYIRKKIQLLLEEGVVGVRRGKGGGYYLEKDPTNFLGHV